MNARDELNPLIKEFRSFLKKVTIVKINDRLFVVHLSKQFFGMSYYSLSKEFRSEQEAIQFFTQITGMQS
ncbi:hypothetical protein DES35_101462 [Schleiferia thermophila]|uniref:Uncharacterized protein n=1 Tax=Schleiferia thermophila TaxID=884107 RepID=A0A369A7C0_9FLAO|nr:hypothetical protein DES35_101462 [Schleiferia thermophila]GCD79306.1 hypothetical protein JCM30197_05530 [Schleiferia thermophila]